MFGINKDLFPELHNPVIINNILKNPLLMPYIDDINKQAELYILSDIKTLDFSLFSKFFQTGDRSKYEAIYFNRRGRLSTFALKVWLYKKDCDIGMLEDIIWSICDEYTWSLPAHMQINEPLTIDLFASETGFALSEVLFMLQDHLSKAVLQRGLAEVRRRILQPFYSSEEKYPWEKMKNNWCSVCASSIGATAIYVEKDPKVTKKIIERLQPTLNRFIDSFEKDGTCLEGLSYWTYGVSFYVSFADLLKRYTKGSVDLLAKDDFKEIAVFQQKCYMDNGLTISISDGSANDSYRMGLTYYLANKFNDVKLPPRESAADYTSDPCFRWCNGIRDLIWTFIYGKAEKKLTPEPLKPVHDILPAAQWMICKNVGSYGLVAKGGHNGEPHNHNDIGSFIFYKNGEVMLTDLGAGLYTKDYFNDKRYTIFCNQSLSHSVPIIEGAGQKGGEEFRAINTKFSSQGEMTLDISKAYDSQYLKGLNRSFKIDKNHGLILEDVYTIDKNSLNIIERFVTLLKPYIDNDCIVIEGENGSIRIKSSDKTLSPKISHFKHLTHEGDNQDVYTIDYPITLTRDDSGYKFIIQ